jgi:undecaprenyl-diphosphatase
MQNERVRGVLDAGESGLRAKGLRARLAARLAPVDSRALLALALVIAGAAAFLRLAAYVAGETPGEFDVHIITALRNPADLSDPIGPGWLEEAMRDLTALGGTIVLLIVSCAAFVFLLMTGKSHAAIVLAGAVVGAIVLSQLLKFGIGRPRPDLVPHGARVYTQSFPSGHAMMSAAVYLTLAALLARTQRLPRVKIFIIGVAALITALVGASRVYLGVHWPTDVLAGWVGGAAWAILCWVVMYWLQRRGQVEKADAPVSGEAQSGDPAS